MERKACDGVFDYLVLKLVRNIYSCISAKIFLMHDVTWINILFIIIKFVQLIDRILLWFRRIIHNLLSRIMIHSIPSRFADRRNRWQRDDHTWFLHMKCLLHVTITLEVNLLTTKVKNIKLMKFRKTYLINLHRLAPLCSTKIMSTILLLFSNPCIVVLS